MWSYNYSVPSNELYHHGIKGQRWGIRRFQKKNGTLTNAGKKHINEEGSTTEKKKSKHRLQLEETYRKQGLTQKEAELSANNRIRSERIIAAAAGVTVAACAAYLINKNIKDGIDQCIKSGESLQRIEMKNTGGKLNDIFYASKGEHDNNRYKGMLGTTRIGQTGEAYILNLKANGNVKVASKKNASKAFKELYKNDEAFRNKVKSDVSNTKNLNKAYERFNVELVNLNTQENGVANKFYSKLKSQGYGAIQDINDMKYSGYNAKNPLIIFDNSSKNIMVESVKKMDTSDGLKLAGDFMKEHAKANAEIQVKQLGYSTAAGAAVGLTGGAVGMRYQDYDNNQYADYYYK